jgi:restriction system protein
MANPKMRQVQPESATEVKTIPGFQALLLPELRVLADGVEHSSQEIRDGVRVQFDIAPHELVVRNKKGKTVFDSNVDLALANLQGAPHGRTKAIEKIREGVYKITEYGKAILSRNPSDLTIKDL